MGREMKDSGIPWIGEIPSDWAIVKIKAGVCKVGSGKTPSGGATSYADEGVLFLRSQNVYDTGLELSNPTYITPEVDEEMKGTRVRPNDVLLNITGGSIGRCCIFPAALKTANVNQHVSIIRVNENVFLPEFMHYYWMSPLGTMAINLYQTGGNREGMSAEAIKNTPIMLIPMNEQRRICEVLDNRCDEINAVLEKTLTSIEEYKKLKQAIITQAVTKGIRGGRAMKESGIPWIGPIPIEWDVSTLGKFISIDSGISVGKKYELGTPLVEVPYLRVANVQGDHIDLSDVTTIMVTPDEAEKYKLKAGQLLMTEGGDRDKLGRGCLWNGEIENCIHQNHVFSVQTDERLTAKYLDYLTTSEVARVYFDLTAKKTTNLACTSKSTIQKFTIPIPSVSEQIDICDHLDVECKQFDKVLQAKVSIIEQLNNYKKSLIYEYVTGKKEVSGEL